VITRRSALATVLALSASLELVVSARAQSSRPSPHMLDSRSREEWLKFLESYGLTELHADAGGAAFRLSWVIYVETNVVPMPQYNFVEAHLNADGSGHLNAGWNRKGGAIDAKALAPFETALDRSGFYTMPDQDPDEASWVDYPPQVLMEADVKGAYHFVHRLGGFKETSKINDASKMLTDLAKARLPSSPDAKRAA
jgi:hypothetical protein